MVAMNSPYRMKRGQANTGFDLYDPQAVPGVPRPTLNRPPVPATAPAPGMVPGAPARTAPAAPPPAPQMMPGFGTAGTPSMINQRPGVTVPPQAPPGHAPAPGPNLPGNAFNYDPQSRQEVIDRHRQMLNRPPVPTPEQTAQTAPAPTTAPAPAGSPIPGMSQADYDRHRATAQQMEQGRVQQTQQTADHMDQLDAVAQRGDGIRRQATLNTFATKDRMYEDRMGETQAMVNRQQLLNDPNWQFRMQGANGNVFRTSGVQGDQAYFTPNAPAPRPDPMAGGVVTPDGYQSRTVPQLSPEAAQAKLQAADANQPRGGLNDYYARNPQAAQRRDASIAAAKTTQAASPSAQAKLTRPIEQAQYLSERRQNARKGSSETFDQWRQRKQARADQTQQQQYTVDLASAAAGTNNPVNAAQAEAIRNQNSPGFIEGQRKHEQSLANTAAEGARRFSSPAERKAAMAEQEQERQEKLNSPVMFNTVDEIQGKVKEGKFDLEQGQLIGLQNEITDQSTGEVSRFWRWNKYTGELMGPMEWAAFEKVRQGKVDSKGATSGAGKASDLGL